MLAAILGRYRRRHPAPPGVPGLFFGSSYFGRYFGQGYFR
jgi:hypothetical protein